MIILALLLFPIVEIIVFIKFVQAYSLMDAILFLFTSGVLGLFIMKMQGQVTFANLQTQMMQGKTPSDKVLHSAFVLLGGFLIFVPGFCSDILGVLCILPGTRHFLLWYFKKSIKQGIGKGNVHVFTNGFPNGFPNGFQRPQQPHREERDAQVIDIEPTRISHINKKIDEE